MRFHDKSIHLMGIGGIGVSSVAQIAHKRGAIVSGCDRADSKMLSHLRAQGISCRVGHDPSHIENIDTLVYSTAISRREPELLAARKHGIEVIHRSEMLARLTDGYKFIGIAGTHGKTTTTWLIANLLLTADLDPTIMLGGNVPKLNGNFRTGDGHLFVSEVDESDGSLLYLTPKWSVINNIETDHVDHYPGGLDEIKEVFSVYIHQTCQGGVVFACTDCENVREVIAGYNGRTVTFGTEGMPDVAARNIELAAGYSAFDVVWRGAQVSRVWLSLPGLHNVRNALGAIAVAMQLGVRTYRIEDALAHTTTVGRRMEKRGETGGITVIDDYGHHPTEVKVTVDALQTASTGRTVVVFQPHRYSRTKRMWREFAHALEAADVLFVTSVYSAGEEPIDGADGRMIYQEAVNRGHAHAEWVPELNHVAERVEPVLREGDTLVTMGAGDVWTVGDAVLHRLTHKEPVVG